MRTNALAIAARYGAALLAVVLMSVVIGAVLSVTRIGNLAILFLIPILAAATRLGRGPAIFASIAAFLFYDWFFVEPLHVFTIADPAEWVALVLFLITAVITSELAARERLRAQFAIRREREATLLYEALRAIAEPDLDAALRAVADRVRIELNVVAVAIDLELAGQRHTATAGDASAISDATHVLATGGDTAHVGRWIRVVQPALPGGSRRPTRDVSRYEVAIRSEERTIGNIALIREAAHASFAMHERRLLTLLATQLGALAARADLQEATTQAEVLRRTDELKSALLSAVSHDLRTPLASILASAGSLRQKDIRWTDAERDEFAETIEQQADRLSRIVTNLLDLSRIEAGALRPDKQLHDLPSLVDDVLARLAPVTARHTILTNVADDLPPISMDEVQIDQVLSNLIENSAKYSPPGSPIEISAHREAGDVVIEVADRGPGIPPSEVEGLFTPFRRSPGVRGVPGFGVGLAVARGLVEAHGGRIWGGNRPDGGARFAFSLPLGDPGSTSGGHTAR